MSLTVSFKCYLEIHQQTEGEGVMLLKGQPSQTLREAICSGRETVRFACKREIYGVIDFTPISHRQCDILLPKYTENSGNNWKHASVIATIVMHI